MKNILESGSRFHQPSTLLGPFGIRLNAYDSEHAILGTFTLAAQNAVSTASGAIVAGGTTLTNMPVGNSQFIIGIGGTVTATPSAPPAGVKAFVVVGTSTFTTVGTFAQSSASSAFNVFSPPVPVGSGGNIATVGLVCTGTASATETIGATTLVVALGPQYT